MKTTAILAAAIATAGMSAFGQGYFNFSTAKAYVYDEFTTPGTPAVAPGNVDVCFLWAASGTTDPLGAGIPTTGSSNSGSAGSAAIASMLTSGWTEGVDNGTGNPAVVADVASGFSKGGISYNGGSQFVVNNTAAGGVYSVVVVGWNNAVASTLSAALSQGAALGWSSAFSYSSGASSSTSAPQFSGAGMAPFGVAPVPEPASLALAGLGGLSMLFLRRRK